VNASSKTETIAARVTPDWKDGVSAIYRLWALGIMTAALTLATPVAYRIGGDN
jgi:hypothetical protein